MSFAEVALCILIYLSFAQYTFSANLSRKTHFECTEFLGRGDLAKCAHVKYAPLVKCMHVKNLKRRGSKNVKEKQWRSMRSKYYRKSTRDL